MSSISDYTFNGLTRMDNDACTKTQDSIINSKIGNYQLTNFNMTDCNMDGVKQVALSQPFINYTGPHNIGNGGCNIDINSKALKNKMIEIETQLKFADKQEKKKKSYFEINFATVVKIDDEIKEKKELEKIVLCDVQIDIYPDLEKSLLDLLHNSGYPNVKFEKKVDFEQLYAQRLN